MKIRVPRLTSEHFFGFFWIIYWGKDILFSYVKAIFLRIPYICYFAEYIFPLTMLIFLLLAFPYLAEILRLADILFAGIVVITYLLNIVLYPENESLTTISGAFFTSVFPLYFIGLRFDSAKHFKALYIMSIINIWAFAFYYLLIVGSLLGGDQAEYESYMGRAYILLPQILVVIYGFSRKKDILNILTGVIGIILLMMCGNRGSVVILMVFIVIHFLFNTIKKRQVFSFVGAFSLFGLLAYFYNSLSALIISLFLKLGTSVRVLERLSDGTFFESDSRNLLQDKLHSAIWENPIIGYGLCSDRRIAGNYAHNYAFELWTAFGVVLGSLLLMVTVYVIVLAWIKSKDIESKSFLLILICVGFLKLFLSSSFLHEGMFFMLLGYCMMLIRRKIEVVEEDGNKK